MFLPIGDTPNPEKYFPVVNWGLIAANVSIFFLITMPKLSAPVDLNDPSLLEAGRMAGMSAYDYFVLEWGYKPGAPELRDLFSSMFLHGGLMHLVGNMLFLWIFGDNVEHRLGRAGYLFAYLATGIMATLGFSILAPGSLVPLIGASGAISGVLGLYFLLFKRNRVKVLVLFFPFLVRVVLIPARWVLGFYVLIDNLLPMLVGAESNVAYGAHLGGFIGGLGIAVVGERVGWRWPWKDQSQRARRAPATRSESLAPETLSSLREHLAAGRREEAVAAVPLLSAAELSRLTAHECVVLAHWLEEAGHHMAAATILRRCIASHPGSSGLARVYLALGLQRLRQGQSAAAYQHLLAVLDHNPNRDTSTRAREALSSIDKYYRDRS